MPADHADSHRDRSEEGGEVRHLPVPVSAEATLYGSEATPIERRVEVPGRLVVAAAGGFIAGVATWVLVRVLRRPRGEIRVQRRRGRRRDKALDVVGSRSFLVDVHLLNKR